MELGKKSSLRGVFVLALLSSLGQVTDATAQDRFIRQPKKNLPQAQPANTNSTPTTSPELTLQPLEDISEDSPRATTNRSTSTSIVKPSLNADSPDIPSNASTPLRIAVSQPDVAGFRWRPRGASLNSTATQPNSTNPSRSTGDSFQLPGFRAPLRSDPTSLQLNFPSANQRAS